MRGVMTIFAVAIIAMMAGALFFAAQAPVKTAGEASAPASVDTPARVTHPEFTLPDLDGTPRHFAEYAGRHRLVNFWATWCAPCRREIPLLKDFHAEQGDDGIMVLGVAVDFPEDVRAYAGEVDFNYPVLVGQMDAMAIAEQAGDSFVALPFTMIVAADGELLQTHLGELHRDQLTDIVDILGRMDSGSIDRETARAALAGL